MSYDNYFLTVFDIFNVMVKVKERRPQVAVV